jgi:hypothetical protein
MVAGWVCPLSRLALKVSKLLEMIPWVKVVKE